MFGHQIREYNQIIYGAGLLLTMIFMPEGLVGIGRRCPAGCNGATSPARGDLAHGLFGFTKPPTPADGAPTRAHLPPSPAAARGPGRRVRATVERGASCGPRTSR